MIARVSPSNPLQLLGSSLVTSLVLIALGSAASAEAQSDDEMARSHFQAGTSYFDQRRFEDAAREFLEAYRLSERSALLLNLSTVYERMNEFAPAAEYLERYLEAEPEAPRRRTLSTRLDELRAQAEAQERARAEQEIDPAPVELGPPVEAPPSTADEGPSGLFIASMAGFGLAVISAAVAIPTGIIAADRHAQLEAGCDANGRCPSELQAVIDEGDAMALTSTIFMFVGIAAAAAGVALLLVDVLTEDGEGDASRARLYLGPGPGGLGLWGSF